MRHWDTARLESVGDLNGHRAYSVEWRKLGIVASRWKKVEEEEGGSNRIRSEGAWQTGM